LNPTSTLDSNLRQLAEQMQGVFRDAIAQANAELDALIRVKLGGMEYGF
jgi:hypothetical protein